LNFYTDLQVLWKLRGAKCGFDVASSSGILSMKKLTLIPLFVILLTSTGCDRILQIDIILPRNLVPYYEWLKSFPSWQPPSDESPPTHFWKEYSLGLTPMTYRWKTPTIPAQHNASTLGFTLCTGKLIKLNRFTLMRYKALQGEIQPKIIQTSV
jgi:hypothetical protein